MMTHEHLEKLWRLAPVRTVTITLTPLERTERRTMVLPTTQPEALIQTLTTMVEVPIEVTEDSTNQGVLVEWTRTTRTETTDVGTTTTSRTTTRDGAGESPNRTPVQRYGPRQPLNPLRQPHLVRRQHPQNLDLPQHLDPAQRVALGRLPQHHRDLLLGLAHLLEARGPQLDLMLMDAPREPHKNDLPDFPSPGTE